MATIKAIEGSSVHQIQSGQVIVDLCSVVKELVENALDASATSLEIRFKNNGLDSIEVADNGAGIAPEDFDSLALKHYTSKLARYDDLTSLTTFGFRGEALSSLCALSKLSVVTSRAEDAPKATRLEFETSGKVKSKTVVASQKGTTVAVEDIFRNLPVRRRELEKNIKREYGKVLGLLHAYACISTGVRFSVSNTPSRGKRIVVFSTKSNPTTRENIANVYGAKTLVALLPLDLVFELHPTTASTQSAKNWSTQADSDTKEVRLKGHISRPVVGEGRQTPDRQMFFVNARPCALPQVSKAINEVYKSYNVTQSPFIFANLELNTNAYDVNVSPDKRTILLHDQTALLEALKENLTEVFANHDQSVPQAAALINKRLPSFKPLAITKSSQPEGDEQEDVEGSSSLQTDEVATHPSNIIRRIEEGDDIENRESVTRAAMAVFASRREKETGVAGKQLRNEDDSVQDVIHLPTEDGVTADGKNKECSRGALEESNTILKDTATATDVSELGTATAMPVEPQLPRAVQDFNVRMGVSLPSRDVESKETATSDSSDDESHSHDPVRSKILGTPEEKINSISNTPQRGVRGVVPSAFDRMRPKRTSPDVATVTIGDQTTSMTLGTSENKRRRIHTPKFSMKGDNTAGVTSGFVSSLRAFSAPDTLVRDESDEDDDEDEGASDPVTIIPALRSRSHPVANTHPLSSSTSTINTSLESEEADVEDGGAKVDEISAELLASEDGSDDEYMDEAEKKIREEAKIAKLIVLAEERAARPSSDNVKRAATVMKGRTRKDTTLQLMQTLNTTIDAIQRSIKQTSQALDATKPASSVDGMDASENKKTDNAEERLSLTVSKADFGRMRVIGQFNLGFILAKRTSEGTGPFDAPNELFIIDQHASDEKYNFERLQSQTVVQNQRLVHPKQLDLTAIEEEIIVNHSAALAKNGFEITVDTSGDSLVGQRCKLVSLPMSREVTFSLSDLEELLALLSEHPESTESTANVPRPSKVRKMFAMRACRSSIMVGKTLKISQMEKVVRHMGELDKPWNCPHGRPTMRHLFSMDGWAGWDEGDGLAMQEVKEEEMEWDLYVEQAKESGLIEQEAAGKDAMEEDPSEWLFTQGQAEG